MGLGRVGFFEKGENWNTWRKTSQTKEEDHQQAESKNSVIARPLTQVTLVGGKCDHLNQPSSYSCSCSSGARPPSAYWSIGTRQCHVKGRP